MKLHVAIGQFEFVEEEINDSAENAKILYDGIKKAFSGDTSMSETTFNEWVIAIVNSDFEEAWGDVETYNSLSKGRQDVLQALKRFKKRNLD